MGRSRPLPLPPPLGSAPSACRLPLRGAGPAGQEAAREVEAPLGGDRSPTPAPSINNISAGPAHAPLAAAFWGLLARRTPGRTIRERRCAALLQGPAAGAPRRCPGCRSIGNRSVRRLPSGSGGSSVASRGYRNPPPGAEWSGPAARRARGGRAGGGGERSHVTAAGPRRGHVMGAGHQRSLSRRGEVTWPARTCSCCSSASGGRGAMEPAAGGGRGAMEPAAGAAPRGDRRRRRKNAKEAKKAAKQLQLRAEAAAAQRAAAKQAASEAARRAKHLRVLGRTSGAERELEELVFGDSLNVEEDELLHRLADPTRVSFGARRAAAPSRSVLRPGRASGSVGRRRFLWSWLRLLSSACSPTPCLSLSSTG